jgi:hypothetical protein
MSEWDGVKKDRESIVFNEGLCLYEKATPQTYSNVPALLNVGLKVSQGRKRISQKDIERPKLCRKVHFISVDAVIECEKFFGKKEIIILNKKI